MTAAFVGRLGAAQLGAVGLSSIIFNFCGMIFNFLVVVTTPTVAAAVAQGDFERVRPICQHLSLSFLAETQHATCPALLSTVCRPIDAAVT